LKSGKTAICISGLVRTGVKAYPVFERFFSSLGDYDVFIHTWSMPEQQRNTLQDLYAPVSYFEEDQKDTSSTKIKIGPFSNMLYSIMMANELKKRYELEHNFRYDLVIKTRFDLIYEEHSRFPKAPILPRTIYSAGGNVGINITDYEQHGISDLIFWGDSAAMDIATNVWRYYRYTALTQDLYLREGWKIDPKDYYLSPGTMIYQRTVDKNIAHIRYVPGINEIPWREDVAHLDPTKDYDKIRERYARQ
jgi:hypothetical protein